MPEISRFLGIIITMFHREHFPPHFHARYGEYSASIKITDFAVLEGYLPPRALGLVMEWAELNKKDLQKDWELALKKKPLLPIKPLK